MGQSLNIRGVPEELMRKVKARAAENGITLREYVLAKLMQPAPLGLREFEDLRVDVGMIDYTGTPEMVMPNQCKHGSAKGLCKKGCK